MPGVLGAIEDGKKGLHELLDASGFSQIAVVSGTEEDAATTEPASAPTDEVG